MYSTWKPCFELQIEAQCLRDPWATSMVVKQQLKTKILSVKNLGLTLLQQVIMNSRNHQLPVGVIALLVEHRTNIAEVRVQVPLRPEFFGSYFAIVEEAF